MSSTVVYYVNIPIMLMFCLEDFAIAELAKLAENENLKILSLDSDLC